MKQRWKQLSAKVDAMTVRERVMMAGASAAAIVFLVFTLLIDPATVRAKSLQAVMQQQRQQISMMEMELQQKQLVEAVDPDKASKEALARISQHNTQLRADLRERQRGLVAPERVSQVLQQMLQGSGRLRLVSLKTFPPRGMSDGKFSEPESVADAAPEPKPVSISLLPAPAAAPGGAAAAPVVVTKQELLYRHGVQVVLQGNYLEMVNYMQALEQMPEQLFWGKAALKADDYPNATLTLTLYTLSLDQKWIAL